LQVSDIVNALNTNLECPFCSSVVSKMIARANLNFPFLCGEFIWKYRQSFRI